MVYGGGASLFVRTHPLMMQATSLLAQWSMVVDVGSRGGIARAVPATVVGSRRRTARAFSRRALCVIRAR